MMGQLPAEVLVVVGEGVRAGEVSGRHEPHQATAGLSLRTPRRAATRAVIVVCDGLKGLPEAIEATWPLAVIQTCVLHLIRNTFRLASRRDWDKVARDLRPVYTAPTEQAAKDGLDEFHATWGERYPAIRGLWANAWAESVPFLDYSPEIRRVIYSTNAIESLHARMRRATRARGHFPNEQGARSAATSWCAASTPPAGVDSDG